MVAQRSRTVYSFTIQPPLRYFPINRDWASFPSHTQAHVPGVLGPKSNLSIQYPSVLKRPLWDQYPIHISSQVDIHNYPTIYPYLCQTLSVHTDGHVANHFLVIPHLLIQLRDSEHYLNYGFQPLRGVCRPELARWHR